MTRVFKWSSNRSSKCFQNMPKWLSIISDGNPRLKEWFAITSDSNLVFKMRKTRRQKDGCSFQRVPFIRAWITLYSCALDLMYASVHHFLYKKRNLLFIAKYFIFYDFSRKYLCKTWWTMKVLEIEWNAFRKSISQSRPKTLYQKI